MSDIQFLVLVYEFKTVLLTKDVSLTIDILERLSKSPFVKERLRKNIQKFKKELVEKQDGFFNDKLIKTVVLGIEKVNDTVYTRFIKNIYKSANKAD